MTPEQYVLTKIAEECNEVAQRALKQSQFGATETEPNQYKTNAQRLREEVLDLYCWISQAMADGLLDQISAADIEHHRNNKLPRVLKMAEYSRSLGMLK